MSDTNSPQNPQPDPYAGSYPPTYYGNGQQGGYQPAYPPPPQYFQQYPPYAVPRTTNGLAIASMVLGILWLYWVGSILALIFGYVARSQIRERNQAGDGMAIAGIVLGWIGVGIVLFVFVMAAMAGSL